MSHSAGSTRGDHGNALSAMSGAVGTAMSQYWIVILVVTGYVVFSLLLLEVYPPPLPDEVLFYSTSRTLLETGRLATPVVIGMEHHAFWMPPGYFLSLAAFMSTFGESLANARLLSILCGSLTLGLTLWIARQLNFGSWITASCLLLLALDPFFLRLCKLVRPESLTLVFIMASLGSHIAWIRTNKSFWNTTTVCAAALASLMHPFGLVAPIGIILHRVILNRSMRLSLRTVIAPGIAILALGGVIVAYVIMDCTDLTNQLWAQIVRKAERGTVTSALFWLRSYKFLPFPFLVIGTAVLLPITSQLKKHLATPAGAVTIVGWLSLSGAVASFEFSYIVYYLPAVLLAGAAALSLPVSRLRWKWIAPALATAAAVNAFLYDGYFAKEYLFDIAGSISSGEIVRQIGDSLPKHAAVLVLGAPNLYWDLASQRPDLRIVYPWAMKPMHAEEISALVQAAVVSRGFAASYDEYMDEEVGRWQELFGESGKTLQPTQRVGKDVPYAYRATVFEIR